MIESNGINLRVVVEGQGPLMLLPHCLSTVSRGRPPMGEVMLVDDHAQARRRQDIVDHDRVARPPCRQLW
jgi:hypothetical protein